MKRAACYRLLCVLALLLASAAGVTTNASGQVPEGEQDNVPIFLGNLDFYTHPFALERLAEQMVESGSPARVLAALEETVAPLPQDEPLQCWGRTLQSIIASKQGNFEAADAYLASATAVYHPVDRLAEYVQLARRLIRAHRTYASWSIYESEHFRIIYPPELPIADDIAFHAIPHDQVYKQIADFFDYEMDRKIDFYLYLGNQQAISLTGFVLSFALPDKSEIHGSLMDSLGHEQAHIVSIQCAGQIGKNTMMGEGIATYLDQTMQGRHEQACAFFERGEILPIEEMLDHFRAYPQEMAYSQAGSFLGYLIELYGRKRFVEFWKSNGDFYEVFERIYDMTVEEAEAEWHVFLAGKSKEYREFRSMEAREPVLMDGSMAAAFMNEDADSLDRASDQLLRGVPRYSLGHYMKGVALLDRQEYEEAAETFETTLKRYPQPPWLLQNTHLHLARCYYALGEQDKAREQVERAREQFTTLEGLQAVQDYEQALEISVN